MPPKLGWKELKRIYDERAEEVASRPRIKGWGIPRKYGFMIGQINLNLNNCKALLDVGCGSGPYTAYLSHRPDSLIVACDISLQMVKEAKRHIELSGNSTATKFSASNLECLPFKDKTFDGIICAQVIEHLLDDCKGLRELYRVLKPAGRLIIATDNKNNYASRLLSFPVEVLKKAFRLKRTAWEYPHKDYEPKEFCAMLSETGFNILNTTTFRFTLPSPLWQIGFLTALVDMIEKFAISLPLVRNWGDIILAVCQKSERE
ncbi:MAG: methyltransferase domain-containing protein [Candidatus Brocadiaceae bacterium]|nr:methyltransferase domain-containing protein [Candidatus Brocadiaceae bacterium]